jgi:uncharacterized protein YndB with AHSA1/START domain
MLHIVLSVVGVVVALILIILIIAMTRPDTFRVQRSTTIAAPPEKAFGILNDFHQWGAWSPWEKMDPAMAKTHSGAASGKGAIYVWKGNNKVGEGRMEILESSPPSRLVIKLDFFKPFEAHNTAEFTTQSPGGSTTLTWAMYGSQPFMVKVMSVFMSMDKMIGKDFEAGLASLKALAEKA